jgi:predicted AlkP superfamily phosphohydrolase/phosphomutase
MCHTCSEHFHPEGSAAARGGRRARFALAGIATMLLAPGTAFAYVGPGAGFALVSSFLVIFSTIVLALLSLLLWPFRALRRRLRRRKLSRPWARRLIIVGFDGQDPKLTERLLAAGKLPNFKRLADSGCYHHLQTVSPPISPVAWSSFATGANPGKHNIFDFLGRDLRTYLPTLSSARIGKNERFLKLGRFRIPLRRPSLSLMRKSRPFWSILGEHGVWSTVLRVPITFPPEDFYGAQLSAMCAPDLLGTQGTFLLYTTRSSGAKIKEGGIRVRLSTNGNRFETTIQGPENTFVEGNPALRMPMSIEVDRDRRHARVHVDGQIIDLEPGRLSDWIRLGFRAAPLVKVRGICRMAVTEIGEHFSLYVSPLNIDPESPAMPISHPPYYATYLAKKTGPYATLGLAEDTWGLNEGVIDEKTFLQLAYDIDDERRRMFFAALDRLREGSLVCVFDATDRIQHMFWRYLDGRAAVNGANPIEELYEKNDALVGEIVRKLRPDDVLLVVSDHGFTSFRRGVNLNAWLQANGYLKLKEGADGSAEWLRDVDWSETRAYALGLTGLFLNLRGREGAGVVEPGEEAARLKADLVEQLRRLRDEDSGTPAVHDVFDTGQVYSGPYQSNAPDLLVGYNEGYRVSWDCATGVVSGPIFEDNEKAWSGDHCVDPRLVPGVLFGTHKISASDPSLMDIAPTALRLIGIAKPGFMEGQCLFEESAFGSGAGSA